MTSKYLNPGITQYRNKTECQMQNNSILFEAVRVGNVAQVDEILRLRRMQNDFQNILEFRGVVSLKSCIRKFI